MYTVTYYWISFENALFCVLYTCSIHIFISAWMAKKDHARRSLHFFPSSKLIGSILEGARSTNLMLMCSLRKSIGELTAYFDGFVNRAERRVKS